VAIQRKGQHACCRAPRGRRGLPRQPRLTDAADSGHSPTAAHSASSSSACWSARIPSAHCEAGLAYGTEDGFDGLVWCLDRHAAAYSSGVDLDVAQPCRTCFSTASQPDDAPALYPHA
jgi:hypothetical protein